MRNRWLALSLVGLAAAGCARKSTAPVRAPAGRGVAAASYSLRRGEATYRHYCQTCHGETGAGDGFNAFNLDPHPRDLSDSAFQKSKKDTDFADAIRRGGAGVGLSPLMPPWGHTLSQRQIAEVVAYLRTFRK